MTHTLTLPLADWDKEASKQILAYLLKVSSRKAPTEDLGAVVYAKQGYSLGITVELFDPFWSETEREVVFDRCKEIHNQCKQLALKEAEVME